MPLGINFDAKTLFGSDVERIERINSRIANAYESLLSHSIHSVEWKTISARIERLEAQRDSL